MSTLFIYFTTTCSVEECLVISNYDSWRGIAVEGKYRRFNSTLFVKDDISPDDETLMLIYRGQGWHGVQGNIRGVTINLGSRWAFIKDIAKPVIGSVHQWTQKGDSSGTIYGKCGEKGMHFIVTFKPKKFMRSINQ